MAVVHPGSTVTLFSSRNNVMDLVRLIFMHGIYDINLHPSNLRLICEIAI